MALMLGALVFLVAVGILLYRGMEQEKAQTRPPANSATPLGPKPAPSAPRGTDGRGRHSGFGLPDRAEAVAFCLVFAMTACLMFDEEYWKRVLSFRGHWKQDLFEGVIVLGLAGAIGGALAVGVTRLIRRGDSWLRVR